MTEHIVKENVFVPETGITYPDKPDDFILQPKILYPVTLDGEYPYLDTSFKAKFLNFSIYTGIFLLVFPLQRIRYGLKIEGKQNLRKYRKTFSNGAITVCNHVYRWDFLAVLQAVKFRRMWFPARDVNVMSSDRDMVRGAGGIPIPDSLAGLRQFNAAFDALHEQKKWIHIFPESCRWEFYQPIRPFKIGAFKMAYKYQVPIIPFVITYRKPTGIYKLFKVKHPLITLRVGEPIFPETKEGERRSEVCQRLRRETHQAMQQMAGIVQNCWEPEGD